MTEDNHITGQEEFALQAMFGRELPPVADAGFSKTVTGRLRRRIWRRRIVLTSATTIGLIIALPMASELLLTLSDGLVALVTRAEQSEALGQFQILLKMLPLRETVQAANQELLGVSTRVNAASLYDQYQLFILAGLMGVVSLLTTRLLGD